MMLSHICTVPRRLRSSSTARRAVRGSEGRSARRLLSTSWRRSRMDSANRRRYSPARTREERSAGRGARKEIATTVSSSLRSARPTDARDELLRRFVEAARRAQMVTIVNRARTEAELGELVTAELCEAFEAEVAFVLAASDDAAVSVVGSYGLRLQEEERLLERGLYDPALGTPQREQGCDLLSIGAQALVCSRFDGSSVGGVVGVARFYDQSCDEAEAALLEAVAGSIGHALERLRLAEERDQLYREAQERGQAARVIGSIADGVLLVDNAGIVRLWNPAAEAMTGLARDEVLGRMLEDTVPALAAAADSVVVANDPAASAV